MPDYKTSDHCGTCTKCIDACPTDAITEPYVVDGSKCISYFTIELKENIPASYNGKFDNWVFGCDICQDVCPWNRFSTPQASSDFKPQPGLLEMSNEDWKELNEETFNETFRGSAVNRTKFSGLRRNIDFIRQN